MKTLPIILLLVSLIFSCKKKEDDEQDAPSFDFAYSLNQTIAPITVTFTATASPAGDVSWDFGDGTSGAGMTTTHTYTSAGFYSVNASLHTSQGNASLHKYVNASNHTYFTIVKLVATAPSLNSSGLTWDPEPGLTAPDLYARIYKSGSNLIPGSPVYFNNSFSMNYVLSPSFDLHELNSIMDVKLSDYDPGNAKDDAIATFNFDMGSSLASHGFATSFSLPSSGGATMTVYVTWH
jgi:PKD repeat protein